MLLVEIKTSSCSLAAAVLRLHKSEEWEHSGWSTSATNSLS